ncbi:MAG: hypothetical protein KDA60_07655 [Planctomycetales bacterium]|nr:hypothetical protein [Planctomycetales bacterium]
MPTSILDESLPFSITVGAIPGVALIASPGWGGGVTDTTHSRHAVVRPVRLQDVQWTEGFWADRFATCRDRSVPAMWDLMRSGKYSCPSRGSGTGPKLPRRDRVLSRSRSKRTATQQASYR